MHQRRSQPKFIYTRNPHSPKRTRNHLDQPRESRVCAVTINRELTCPPVLRRCGGLPAPRDAMSDVMTSEADIRAERVRAMFQQTPVTMTVAVINASIMTVVLVTVEHDGRAYAVGHCLNPTRVGSGGFSARAGPSLPGWFGAAGRFCCSRNPRRISFSGRSSSAACAPAPPRSTRRTWQPCLPISSQLVCRSPSGLPPTDRGVPLPLPR